MVGLSEIDTHCPSAHRQQEDCGRRVVLKFRQGLGTFVFGHGAEQGAVFESMLRQLRLEPRQGLGELGEDEAFRGGVGGLEFAEFSDESVELGRHCAW